MSFVVNGAEWAFHGMPSEQAEALIERALEFIATSAERGEEVAVGDDFQTRPMHGTSSLWDLFSPTSLLRLRRELSEELAAWLGKAPRYADADEWPQGFGDTAVSIAGGAPAANADVEWVHFAVLSGKAMACLTLDDAQVVETTTAAGSAAIHFVADEPSRKAFWRDAIVLAGDDLDALRRYASRAYPDLHFVDGVLDHAASLAGGYLASRHRVRTALASLDDWGSWVFTCPPPAITPHEGPPPDPDARPTNQLIEHRLAGLQLEAAPEKPNVRLDRVSREARETVLGGEILYCEWHIKLEPHRNRIHFHAPASVSADKVVIGMIDEHLPLP